MNVETGDFVGELMAALGVSSSGKAPSEECAVLAQTMMDLYSAGKTSGFGPAFDVIEKYTIFGTEEEQRLVIVGFLETLKNLCVQRDLDYAVFEEWIQPETYQAWRWLEKHWQGKRSLASAAEGSSEKLYIPPKKEL
jgi:hypothetical protein